MLVKKKVEIGRQETMKKRRDGRRHCLVQQEEEKI
jgi:hypothetical protein